jgi:hypothetical protein
MRKVFFDSMGFFYFLFLRFLMPKFHVTKLRLFSILPAAFLLNLIRGAQFWIFHCTQSKCLWSAKSIAPYEFKTKGQYSLALSYKMVNGVVVGHASSGDFLANDEYLMRREILGWPKKDRTQKF